jgi:hypothetical protein
MNRLRHNLKIDRELLQQLEDSDAHPAPLQVVFGLRSLSSKQQFLSAAQTEEIAHQLLGRVHRETGLSATDWNIFRNLGTFVVSAPGPFIRKLLEQKEIASATANRQPTSFQISPRNKRTLRKRPLLRKTLLRRSGARCRRTPKKHA